MYISIARYAGMAGKIGEAAPKVEQSLVPMLKVNPASSVTRPSPLSRAMSSPLASGRMPLR